MRILRIKNVYVVILLGMALSACETEDSAWAKIQAEPTEEALNAYIEAYESGAHVDAANSLLVELQAWQSLEDKQDFLALRNFRAQYPEGYFAGDAGVAMEAAKAQFVEDFDPLHVMILIGKQLQGRDDGLYRAQWRGPIRYSLGSGGGFTGMATYIEPDPTEVPVVVAVLDAEGMQSFLQQGKAYIWLGGTDLIEWRDVSQWTTWQTLGEALGMPPSTEYAPVPAQFLLP